MLILETDLPPIFHVITKMLRSIPHTLTLTSAVHAFLVPNIHMDNKNTQSGQSTIEFILTFAFGVSFIFVIFNGAMNYATGYIVHYATFMASRTYLTADSHKGIIGDSVQSMSGAEAKAREVFNNYNLNIFKIDSSNFTINPAGNTSPETYLTVGGQTSFDLTMDVLGRVAGQKKLELVSEAFLGKEVTRAECATRTCFAITGTTTCTADMDITLFDDGC